MKSSKVFKLFTSSRKCLKRLVLHNILDEKIKCKKCRRITLKIDKKGIYRCRYAKCRYRNTFWSGTIFKNSKIRVNKMLAICWLYIYKMPVAYITDALGTSPNTVCRWSRRIRNIAGESIKIEENKIGGEGIIVEVDETKLGKRKYHRGHKVDGVWCLVAIERTPEKRFVAIEVENRNYETIKEFFKKYIDKGSVIYTDGWKSYKKVVESLGCKHKLVNHSLRFKIQSRVFIRILLKARTML